MADDIDLRSVNWVQGMFLTPDHFLRQEKYSDSLMLWLMRHVLPSAGLVGCGARADSAERGAARFDPIVEVDDTNETLNIAVTQCRAITKNGVIIDIDPSRPVRASFPKRALEGVVDLGVYLRAHPHEKEPDDSIEDPVNRQLASSRRHKYSIQLDVRADEAPTSVLLARLEREETSPRFKRKLAFIPPCVFMCSHSELMDGYRRLSDKVALIADHYGALHRSVVDFIYLAQSRGLNVQQDTETLSFVNQMVLTLEACVYELMDPVQPPQSFFRQLTRLVRSSALFLSLSPPTREYFRQLGEIGEGEFVSLLEQDRQALGPGRGWSMHEDLGQEVARTMSALDRLHRLEQALEGRYMDFRVSPSLENINFVFDRTAGEPVLYRSVAKPARPQAHGQDLTFVFAPLRLEPRETYRLILIGERDARFQPNDQLSAELLINPGEGYSHQPIYKKSEWEVEGHKNFALDFKAPSDLVSINDLRVSVRGQPVRSAILYVRARLQSGRADAGLQTGPREPGPRPAPVRPPVVVRTQKDNDDSTVAHEVDPNLRNLKRRRSMTEIE